MKNFILSAIVLALLAISCNNPSNPSKSAQDSTMSSSDSTNMNRTDTIKRDTTVPDTTHH